MNSLITKRNRVNIYIYILIFAIIFILSSITPIISDDYSYCFNFADFEKRITNIGAIIPSMKAHRITMNGRVFSHALVQIFLLMPKMLFNICNAINSVLLTFLVQRFFRTQNNFINSVLIWISAITIWLAMPAFGQVFLWLDGSLNYSWAMTAILLYLYPFFAIYEKNSTQFSIRKSIIWIVFSFVAGGYSENASCAAIFMAFCFMCLYYFEKKHVPVVHLCAWISSIGGFLFMMLNPSELGGRTTTFNLAQIAHNIQRCVMLTQEKLLLMYCVVAVLLVICFYFKVDRKSIYSVMVLTLGSMLAIAVFAFATYLPERSLCAPCFFLLISILIMLSELVKQEEKLTMLCPMISSVMTIVFAFSFVLGVGDIAVVYYESRQREAHIYEALANGESSVTVPRYSGNTKYNAAYQLIDVQDDCSVWPNDDISRYYGLERIYGTEPHEDYFS